MLKHDKYEEICAAASIGEASPEDLANLEMHASGCPACRHTYAEYLEIAARHFATADSNPCLSPDEAEACLNSDLLARRFFERAEREGIMFSSFVAPPVERPDQKLLGRRMLWVRTSRTAAAIVLVGLTVSGLHYGLSRLQRNRTPIVAATVSSRSLEGRIQDLSDKNRTLELRVNELSSELSEASRQLSGKDAEVETRERDRERIESERNILAAELSELRKELAESKDVVEKAREQLARENNHAADMEATLAANQVRIADLNEQIEERSAALEKEQQLLAMGHDVTDLMAARNLHIVDVVDTDARGKTRPAFGRIFFTEGKSLVFYAYDLNESKMQKANYQYRVWAKKEGGNEQVQSLGIFYSDDKLQKRWVFKCNDPKILSEIDSVFVTLEPTNTLAERPNGPNLMYAYLHGQPNHP